MKITKINNLLIAVLLSFVSINAVAANSGPDNSNSSAVVPVEQHSNIVTGRHDEQGYQARHQETQVVAANSDDHDHDHESETADSAAEDDGHGHGTGAVAPSGTSTEEPHQTGISFSAEKMALANIRVAILSPKVFARYVYAPGEIKANGYKSYIVSPRTESVVISRHAILGEQVEKGQPLVTLFSESVAQAQAIYRVAFNEWQRVKKMGKKTVSESRLLAAQTDYIAASSRLKAFGLTEQAIAQVVQNNSSNFGQYSLIAQRSGAVLSDDFSQGQRVSAGDALMVLANEDELWVEARVSPSKKLNLPIGTKAILKSGNESFVATVIQEAHTIDPVTRTRIVRLAVKNPDDKLHPGMFVDVNFSFDTDQPVMAVPETALMRGADGDWVVFVEDHPGEFKAVEVELGLSLGQFREITGVAPVSRIVIEGAFFVASEIAKGGFDPHNH